MGPLTRRRRRLLTSCCCCCGAAWGLGAAAGLPPLHTLPLPPSLPPHQVPQRASACVPPTPAQQRLLLRDEAALSQLPAPCQQASHVGRRAQQDAAKGERGSHLPLQLLTPAQHGACCVAAAGRAAGTATAAGACTQPRQAAQASPAVLPRPGSTSCTTVEIRWLAGRAGSSVTHLLPHSPHERVLGTAAGSAGPASVKDATAPRVGGGIIGCRWRWRCSSRSRSR